MPILMRRLAFLFILSSTVAFSQIEDINTAAEDLVFLTNLYISPAAQATVYQASGGWYTSAKTKSLWDVEISIQGNMLFIPNKYKTFTINESDLQNINIMGQTTSAQSPTALGEDDVVVLQGNIGDDTFEFDSPEGINEPNVKHVQFQVGLGLWHGTTLIARYSPEIKIKDTDYQVLGVGLQHSISQWIPSLSESKYNIAGLITYSDYSFSDTFSEVDLPIGTINSVLVDGQSFSFNIIASRQIQRFNISSAIGITSSAFNYKIGGDGDVLLSILNSALQSLDESQTNFKLDFGVDYKLNDFSVNTMLTIGKFANLVIGVNYNL